MSDRILTGPSGKEVAIYVKKQSNGTPGRRRTLEYQQRRLQSKFNSTELDAIISRGSSPDSGVQCTRSTRIEKIIDEIEFEYRSGAKLRQLRAEGRADAKRSNQNQRVSETERPLYSEGDVLLNSNGVGAKVSPENRARLRPVKPVRPMSETAVSCAAKGNGDTKDSRVSMGMVDIEERGPKPLGYDDKRVPDSVSSRCSKTWTRWSILDSKVKNSTCGQFDTVLFVMETRKKELTLDRLKKMAPAAKREEFMKLVDFHFEKNSSTGHTDS